MSADRSRIAGWLGGVAGAGGAGIAAIVLRRTGHAGVAADCCPPLVTDTDLTTEEASKR